MEMKAQIGQTTIFGSPLEMAEFVNALEGKTPKALVVDEKPNGIIPEEAQAWLENEFEKPVEKVKRKYVKRTRNKNKRWTPEEDLFVKKNYGIGKMKSSQIAKKLGRTTKGVTMHANNLGLNIHKRVKTVEKTFEGLEKLERVPGLPSNRWTEREEAYLKSNWHNGRNMDFLVKAMNRTPAAISMRAWQIGLRNQT